MSPEPDPKRRARAEDLFADYLARVDAGEAADFEKLCRSHPDLTPILSSLKANWDELESLRDRLLESQTRMRRNDPGSDHATNPRTGTPVTDAAAEELMRRLRQRGPFAERYRIFEEFSRGSMGAISRVWDEDLGRTMAMKVARERRDGTPESPGAFSRFIEEAQITGQLEHPGIVPVHELGLAANGRVYFTMRLVKGRTLREIYDLVHTDSEGWNTTRALHVLLKVCEAVSYAHDKAVIHRDLKPANVMVGRYGEVYVMDWGLARALGAPKTRAEEERAAKVSKVVTNRARNREGDTDSAADTQEGEILGTPVYMPPEQALGHIDELGPPSDVYAVGAMLYHLLSGKLPYVEAGERPSPFTVVERVLAGPPTPLSKISNAPSELVAICEKAMARNPEMRYRTMGEFSEDLRAFLEERVVRAYQVGPWAETRKWMRRNQALAASLAAGIVAVTALAGLFVRNLNRVAAGGPGDSNPAAASTALDEPAQRIEALFLRVEQGDPKALEELETEVTTWTDAQSERAAKLRERLDQARAKR